MVITCRFYVMEEFWCILEVLVFIDQVSFIESSRILVLKWSFKRNFSFFLIFILLSKIIIIVKDVDNFDIIIDSS